MTKGASNKPWAYKRPVSSPKAPKGKTPASIRIAYRREFAVALRAAGANFQEIADQIRDEFDPEDIPEGYDAASASRDVGVVLDQMYAEMGDHMRVMRMTQMARYESIIRANWPKAMRGDLGATDRVLKAMKDENRMLGLDAPQRIDMRVQQVDQRIEQLINALGSGELGRLEPGSQRKALAAPGAGSGDEENATLEGAYRSR